MYLKSQQMGKKKKTRTQINKIANKKLLELQIEKDIRHCELCSTQAISNAHRHPRNWYRSHEDRSLWDFKQVLFLCIKCHKNMDDRSKTTENEKEVIFNRLRPESTTC